MCFSQFLLFVFVFFQRINILFTVKFISVIPVLLAKQESDLDSECIYMSFRELEAPISVVITN